MKGRTGKNGKCERYCTRCGFTEEGHTWYWCKCTVCGALNPKGQHDWEIVTEGDYTDIRVCRVCGKRNESEKCLIVESKKRREMQEMLEQMNSLHDMRAKGIQC